VKADTLESYGPPDRLLAHARTSLSNRSATLASGWKGLFTKAGGGGPK
jgi:hypothetical protein